MKEKRYELASTLDQNDNLWIIGGSDGSHVSIKAKGRIKIH